MTAVRVGLKDGPYKIDIVSGKPEKLQAVLARHAKTGRLVVVSNSTIWKMHGDAFLSAVSKSTDAQVLLVGDGEAYKSLRTAEKLYTELIERKIRRNDLLVAFGGGVIGDLAGYIAATYQRGIPFVQVPTTLLAQVDSSVGGKVAVNHPKGKNMIGAFYQPKHVLIDTAYLTTLPEREFVSGLAEVVKTAMLSGGRSVARLEENAEKVRTRRPTALRSEIKECVAFKAEIVAKDEKDLGLRSILNLGHTLAHAIEVLAKYGSYLHGEAVSIGLVFACLISRSRGYIGQNDLDRVVALLRRLSLPVQLPDIAFELVLEQFDRDKKKMGPGHTFILLKAFGRPVQEIVSKAELRKAYQVQANMFKTKGPSSK